MLKRIALATSFNRIVVNDTTLEGRCDFDFKFANEFAGRGGPPVGAPPAQAPADEPAMVIALQEQLGQKLDARRATVDVMVVDSVDTPSEDRARGGNYVQDSVSNTEIVCLSANQAGGPDVITCVRPSARGGLPSLEWKPPGEQQ